MLYDADPTISSPLALHAFRHVYWNDRLREFDSKRIGVGVTRVPLSSIVALLSDLDTADPTDMHVDDADQQHNQQPNRNCTSNMLGWHLLNDEVDEHAAAMVIADIGLADGDLLDCVIQPDPTLTMAPKLSRTIDRDRPADRYSNSRR